MSAPILDLAIEAARAGKYPKRLNKREAKMLEAVQSFVNFRIVAAGNFTTAGGDAAESIAVSGALASDLAIVMVKTAGAVPRSIVAATAASDAINVTMSGDPSTDHVLSYVLLRDV